MKHGNVAIFVPHVGCPHQCSFCDQRTISGSTVSATPETVKKTCAKALDYLGDRASSCQIAFFGGSFTAIERSQMVSLLGAAQPFLGDGGFQSIRISTRPDAIDEERLSLLKEYGVLDIELGAQSMDNRVLTLNQRGHTAEDTRNASQLIRNHGFSLGLQMMTGLFGDSDGGAVATVKELIRLCPDTARIYPTLVLPGTRLAQLYEAGDYHPQTLDNAVSLAVSLQEMFEEAGVKVIRVGLHSEESVRMSVLAGPYHPAFGELCENQQFFRKMIALLPSGQCGQAVFTVSSGDLSKAIGQKRKNILCLSAMGWEVRVRKGESGQEIRLEEVTVFEAAITGNSGV